MTTLDDLREAGYDVVLAWEGYRDPNNRVVSSGVYAVSREGTQLDPTQPNFDGGLRVYVHDTPSDLDDFLESVEVGENPLPHNTPDPEPEVDPREPPGELPVESKSENLSGDK